MFKETFGYGVWIGLLILIIFSVLFLYMGRKHDKRWYILAAGLFIMAVAISLMQYKDAKDIQREQQTLSK